MTCTSANRYVRVLNKVANLPAAARCLAVALGALALTALLCVPGKAEPRVPSGPFVLVLLGIYEPVAHGPDLGLSLVDLSDGSYSKCDIHRVSGLPGGTDQAIGTFYVNFDVTLCAYQLAGGTFTAVVEEFVYEDVVIDGELYQVGTVELTIPEATGIYQSYVGGSIHMEFATHVIDEVTFDEFCLCFFSR